MSTNKTCLFWSSRGVPVSCTQP